MAEIVETQVTSYTIKFDDGREVPLSQDEMVVARQLVSQKTAVPQYLRWAHSTFAYVATLLDSDFVGTVEPCHRYKVVGVDSTQNNYLINSSGYICKVPIVVVHSVGSNWETIYA